MSETFVRLLVVIILFATPCSAWWECGHHIIALMAYQELKPAEQARLCQLLQAHPRFDEDFRPPPNVDPVLWRVGNSGYWPDIARRSKVYNRPTWHYHLGSSLNIGNVSHPTDPGPLPRGANLDTQSLYLSEAVALCRRVMGDQTSKDSDKALAICWIAHCVGDAHQPCHGGSLYVEGVFPTGDRGANSIPTKQRRNLHALWDSLLGERYDTGDIKRRIREIKADKTNWQAAIKAAQAPDGLKPRVWIRESQELGRLTVYTDVVMNAVEAARRSGATKVETVDLPEAYLKNAGRVAKVRAGFAAQRLAAIWREGLK